MGKHLILDFKCFDRELMESKTMIEETLNKCVKLVNMKKLVEPIVVDGAEHNKGVTAFVMNMVAGFTIIETSHISIHTFSDRNKIAFDLYSCRDFDENKIKNYLLFKFNNSEIINEKLLERYDN